VGCAGLGLRDGFDALIAADWSAFAERVGDVLSDAALRSRVATQARRTAEKRFSWKVIARSAYDSYQGLLQQNARN
jgi:glycosyltransferase involved in cell wall biosynthesis